MAAWVDERTDEWVKGWLDEWRQMDRWMNVFLTRFLEGWSESLNQKSANFFCNGTDKYFRLRDPQMVSVIHSFFAFPPTNV